MIKDLLLTGILQGLMLAIVAYAVMIPFRLLNFPDLTSEGSFPLGGAICSSGLLMGLAPIFAIFLAILGAGLMGIATSLIHLRFKVNTLLAGIIVSTMIYSINLRILTKPNVSLFTVASLFSQNNSLKNIFILSLILMIVVIPLALFLATDLGLKMRAVGLNPDFSRKHGISITRYTILGLFIAGSLGGLAGSLMVQLQNYMDISMGLGIVIHALAALMIGEALIGNDSISKQLIAPVCGALIYQQIQGFALSMGLEPSDLKFFTGCIVLFVIAMKRRQTHAII